MNSYLAFPWISDIISLQSTCGTGEFFHVSEASKNTGKAFRSITLITSSRFLHLLIEFAPLKK